MERDPTVNLGAEQTRCSAVSGCNKASSCARRMATIPSPHGSVGDFSRTAHLLDECPFYLPIRRGYQEQTQPRKVVKDWPGAAW